MNYTEIIEKMNGLNGWVLISVIVSVAAALLAIACIRLTLELSKNMKIRQDVHNAISVLIKEQERYSAAIRELNQKLYKLEKTIKNETK